jgi:microfibrillar-associated protein 1
MIQDVEILKRHDYTAPTQSTVDMAVLPKVMQKRDWGKRSQTKYTHLLDQDTTQGNSGFGGAGLNRVGGGKYGQPGSDLLCYHCGGPHMKRGTLFYGLCCACLTSLQIVQPMCLQ